MKSQCLDWLHIILDFCLHDERPLGEGRADMPMLTLVCRMRSVAGENLTHMKISGDAFGRIIMW